MVKDLFLDMAREVELANLSAAQRLTTSAELALDQFYQAQTFKHRQERERLEKIGFDKRPYTKWNRQELYLNPESRSRAKAVSREHLLRHPEWWLQGSGEKLQEQDLRDFIALHHFLWVDLDDLYLEPEARRSEDVFAGLSGNMCEQFLLDVTRSVFSVDDQVFEFAKEIHNRSVELGSHETEKLKTYFSDRVSVAVEKCLGKNVPQLARAVTIAMSQSGLANLERACLAPQVAVSGGEQQLRFALRSVAPEGPWDLDLSVRKAGFEQCIVYRPPLGVRAQGTPATDLEDEYAADRKSVV